MKKFLTLVAACGVTLSVHAGCYSVYNNTGRLIYQSTEAPVDTTYNYHVTVPQRFGQGTSLVYINDGESCLAFSSLAQISSIESNRVSAMGGQNQGRPRRADRG